MRMKARGLFCKQLAQQALVFWTQVLNDDVRHARLRFQRAHELR